MPELYIIRHGLAGEHGSYADDRLRPLTEEGQRKTEKIAQRLAELGLEFDLIQTSSLVRARQTADILLTEGLGKSLEEFSELEPGGSFTAWIQWLGEWLTQHKNGVLAIVGHEPDLSRWAEQLVWGTAQGKLVLKKAGAIGITLPESGSPVGQSELFWLTPPRFLL